MLQVRACHPSSLMQQKVLYAIAQLAWDHKLIMSYLSQEHAFAFVAVLQLLLCIYNEDISDGVQMALRWFC